MLITYVKEVLSKYDKNRIDRNDNFPLKGKIRELNLYINMKPLKRRHG